MKLCREAAVGERYDAELFYNPAVAENAFGFRESAYTALRRGLAIDVSHAGLQRLALQVRLREQRAVIPALPQGHLLNRRLANLRRGSRTPYPDRDR